jgi:hypothetical protein
MTGFAIVADHGAREIERILASLMALRERSNWWAPGPLLRLHGRFGLGDGPSGSAEGAR